MRVTDSLIFDNAQRFTSQASERVADATEVASTGLRVQHPVDDPAAAGLISTHEQAAARAQAISQTVSIANSEVNAADGALDTVTNALTRAHELTVQFANGSYSAADRAAGAAEIDGLRAQIIAALNLRVGTRYVFGGTQDSQPPFDAAGNYLGDTLPRQVEVAPGIQQTVSLRADVGIKGVGGGVDALATLQSLSTALTTNNVAGVQAALPNLDTSLQQASQLRAQAGTYEAALSDADTIARATTTTEQTTESQLRDADAIQAYSTLALAQRALEASLTASTTSFKLTLVGK
jgi:flagellar hook-associated protein 3 FlgL